MRGQIAKIDRLPVGQNANGALQRLKLLWLGRLAKRYSYKEQAESRNLGDA